MAGIEAPDIDSKLSQAKAAFARYKQRLIANPRMKGQLEPILQGYQELISDLEKERQRHELQGNRGPIG